MGAAGVKEQSGQYSVTVTRRGETVGAFVTREGRKYGVTIGASFASCSCPDSMYRGRACKHVGMVREALKAEAMERLVERFEASGYEVVPERVGDRVSLWIYDPETDFGREIPPDRLEAMLAEMATAQGEPQAA